MIERIVAGGAGLARSSAGIVLLRGGLPGERVLARLTQNKGYRSGEVIRILEPAPERVNTPLPPSADLPLNYPAQLQVKQELLRETLLRLGGIDYPVEPVVPSPRQLHYRTSAQYAIWQGQPAYRLPGTHQLIPVGADPLVAEPLAKVLPIIGQVEAQEVVLRGSLLTGEVVAGIIAERPPKLPPSWQELAGVIWGRPAKGRFWGQTQLLRGRREIKENFGGIEASVGPASFAQVNPLAAGALYRDAAALASPAKRAIELYAGSGVFSSHISPKFSEMVAIEISPDAIRRGRQDAAHLGASNIKFIQADAQNFTGFLPADLVVLDPPRAGLAPAVREALAKSELNQILYISCDPASLARDLGFLTKSDWQPTLIRPYDFYPYTHHLEVLVRLER